MKFLYFLFMFGFSVSAFSGGPGKEGLLLRGKVADANNQETLAGVKVTIKGTSISAYTDFDGNFSLIIPNGTVPVLDFEMVSYEPLTTTAPATEGEQLSISLKERE